MNNSKLALALICIISAAGIATAFGMWLYVDSQKLRVGYVVGDVNHAALYYASAQGMYNDAGLDLEFTGFNGEQDIMEALHAGQLDIALVGLAPAVLYNRVYGTGLKVLAAASVNGSAIVVRNDSSINTITDLNSTTIAIPAADLTQDFLLRAILNGTLPYEGSTNTTDNITITIMQADSMPLALNDSTIDAFVAWEAVAAKGVHDPEQGRFGYPGKYLANSSATWPNHPSSVVVARTALLSQPAVVDVITRFLHVHAAATDAVNAGKVENPQTSAFYVTMEREMGINEGDMAMALRNTGFTYQPSMPLVKSFVGNMSAFGLIPAMLPAEIDSFLASFYDTTLLNQSLLL